MAEMQRCIKCNCLFRPSAVNIEENKMSSDKANSIEPNQKDTAVKCKCSGDSANNEGSTLDLGPNCQSSVKIIVRTCNDGLCTKCNSSSHESTSGEIEENKKAKEANKNVCIRLCTKKKRAKKAVQTKSKGAVDDTNQTSRISINPEERALTSDASLNKILKSCEGPCAKGCGGCNRNTIIFPRCTPCGDGGANLESLIKHEFGTFTRSLDEILSTLSRQRQDLRDIRDTVDMILRYMREQFYMSSSQTKTKLDWRENDAPGDKKKRNFNKMFSLERKSNTTSIKSEEKLTKKDASASKLSATPRTSSENVKKKKHFWDYISSFFRLLQAHASEDKRSHQL